MNTSILEEQQPAYAAANSLLGVDYDRIDPYTCRVIHTLFPPHTCGFAFFTGLLRNAIVKQCALPDNLADVRRDAAVVSIKGYAELSLRLGLSYDTTHMYLVVYRALGLLSIEKQAKQTEIIIPLHVYRPPTRLAETLWQLQEHYRTKRPRVRRLVNNVIERLATLVQTESEQKCYKRPILLQPDQPPCHTEILTRVQQVLAIKDIEDPDGQIATCIVTAVTPFIVTHIEALSSTQEQQEVHAFFSQICPENQQGETTEHQESSSFRRQEQIEKRPVRVNLPTTLSREAGLQGSICRKTGQPRVDGRFSAQNLPTLLPKRESIHCNSPQKPTQLVARGRFDSKNLHVPQPTGEVLENIFADDGRFTVPNLPANQQSGDSPKHAPELMSMNLPLKVDSEDLLLNGNGNGNGENNIMNLKN